MELDDVNCEHAEDAACSCPIAREIEQHGLSSTFHCRFTVDGSSCGEAECPYSHVKLTSEALRYLCIRFVPDSVQVPTWRAPLIALCASMRWVRYITPYLIPLLTSISVPVPRMSRSGGRRRRRASFRNFLSFGSGTHPSIQRVSLTHFRP
jgi:hypothetical protein